MTADLVALVHEAPREDLPTLIGQLETAKAIAWARLSAPPSSAADRCVDPDRNLSAAEAASRLGVSKVYLYRNASTLPFARRIGRRVVFSARGLEKWSRDQRARV